MCNLSVHCCFWEQRNIYRDLTFSILALLVHPRVISLYESAKMSDDSEDISKYVKSTILFCLGLLLCVFSIWNIKSKILDQIKRKKEKTEQKVH